jgi:hypothetical protein
MMDTNTSMVLTGVIVAGGQWAQSKTIPIKIVVGGGIAAIFLAAISATNDKLARQFALLILVGAIFAYGIPIATKLGYYHNAGAEAPAKGH